MPQRIVIKLPPNGKKSRSKAPQIAFGVRGVASAALAGENNTQLEVTGEGIDAVKLTNLLRRSVGYCELVSVGPVPDPDPNAPDPNAPATQVPWHNYPYGYGPGHMTYVMRDQNPDNCTIM